VLTSKTAVEEKATYTIRNIDQKAKTLIIEHPLRPDYRLMSDLKPTEKTPSRYRFEVKLGPNTTDKLVVAEERILEQTLQITDLDSDQLLLYVRNRNLSEAARKQLEQLSQKKQELARAQGDIKRAETEINEVVKDQERIRQNITSLNRVTGQETQVRKYSADLAATETKLAALRDQQSEARKRVQTLDGELDALAEKLEF
jgi:chromosome segregation ATPase